MLLLFPAWRAYTKDDDKVDGLVNLSRLHGSLMSPPELCADVGAFSLNQWKSEAI